MHIFEQRLQGIYNDHSLCIATSYKEKISLMSILAFLVADKYAYSNRGFKESKAKSVSCEASF